MREKVYLCFKKLVQNSKPSFRVLVIPSKLALVFSLYTTMNFLRRLNTLTSNQSSTLQRTQINLLQSEKAGID